MISIALTILASYIAVCLICGQGPKWTAITVYWAGVTIKNLMDARGRIND